jgi:hypothetical protein
MAGHDVTVRSEGSLYIITGHTIKAQEHLAEHMPEDAPRWAGGYAVETQYVMAIIDDLIDAGFMVST